MVKKYRKKEINYGIKKSFFLFIFKPTAILWPPPSSIKSLALSSRTILPISIWSIDLPEPDPTLLIKENTNVGLL